MKLTNKVMLITYPDSLGDNLKDLQHVLSSQLDGVVGGVHILPFFPSAGDRGFSPVDYQQVDPKFGDWNDIQTLAKNYYLMFDFMVNHISKHSKYFQDFLQNHDQSKYRDLFIHWDEFWPAGRPLKRTSTLSISVSPRHPSKKSPLRTAKPAKFGIHLVTIKSISM